MVPLSGSRVGGLAAFSVAVAAVLLGPQSSDAGVAVSCAEGGVVSGRVAEPGVEAGARVRVYTDAVDSATRKGDVVLPSLLGEGETDASGCFTVAPADAATWIQHADVSGTLVIRLVVSAPDRLLTTTRPVALASSGRSLSVRESSSSRAPLLATRKAVTGRAPVVGSLRVDFDPAESGPMPAASLASGSSAQLGRQDYASVPTTAATCNGGYRWKLRKRFGNRNTVVGQWWSSTKATKQVWKFGKGTSSYLGAAWSVGGAPGSFNGTRAWSKSVDSVVTFPAQKRKVGVYFRSFFKYGKYDYQQYDYCAGEWVYIATWVRTTKWVKGTDLTKGVSVPAQKKPKVRCSPYRKGSTDETAVSTAMTWSDGVTLSAAMKGLLGDLTLSSRTGFTSSTRNFVHFKFGRGRLCGRYGDLSKPGALIARPPR